MNPKDVAGSVKTPLQLVPMSAVASVAEALAIGAKKYGPFNWRDTPVQRTPYYGAAMRHLAASFDGEEIDPETGVNHIAHAIAGLMVLLDSINLGIAIDDRPKAGSVADVMRKYSDQASKDKSRAPGGVTPQPDSKGTFKFVVPPTNSAFEKETIERLAREYNKRIGYHG